MTEPRLPDYARDVIDAVQHGIMSREEARRYLGLSTNPLSLSPPQRLTIQAFPQLAERRDVYSHHPMASYLGRVALGICWRTSLVGAAILVAQSGYAPPLAAVAVLLLLGSVAGLWLRPGSLGQAWRWAALSLALAWIGPIWSSEYGHLVATVLVLAAVTPWLATRYPRSAA